PPSTGACARQCSPSCALRCAASAPPGTDRLRSPFRRRASPMTVKSTDAGGQVVESHVDAFGRPRRTEWFAYDGSKVEVHERYDALGRLRARSVPVPAGAYPGPNYEVSTTYSYDNAGRLVQISRPLESPPAPPDAHAADTWTYPSLAVTLHTDPEGRQTAYHA